MIVKPYRDNGRHTHCSIWKMRNKAGGRFMSAIKKRTTLYIAIGLAVSLAVVGIIAMSKGNSAPSSAELLSLGEKYLSELDYEQALVQFLKVIEIEPMNERAYLGAAEAYVGLGQTEEAVSILEQGLEVLPSSDALEEKLEEISQPDEPDRREESESEPVSELELTSDVSQELSNEPETSGARIIPLDEYPDWEAAYAEPLARYYQEAVSGDLGWIAWGANAPEDYTYAFCDIDGNGIAELVKSANGVYEVYTLVNDEPISIASGGYRSGTIDIEDSGVLSQWGSSGATTGGGELWTIAGDGGDKSLLYRIEYEYGVPGYGEGARHSITDSNGVVTELTDREYTEWAKSNLPSGTVINEVLNYKPITSVQMVAVPSNDEGLFSTMSKSERGALHLFFSNFSEVWMDEFDISNYNINSVVNFALMHDYRNNMGRFTSTGDGYLRISSQYVERNLALWLGISNIDHNAYTDSHHYYRGGNYYLMAADGAPARWSQVTAFSDNGDGTYTAKYDVYEGHYMPGNPYEDISDWNLNTEGGRLSVVKKGEPTNGNDVWNAAIYSHSCTAIVKQYSDNGRQTYQLLHLEIA